MQFWDSTSPLEIRVPMPSCSVVWTRLRATTPLDTVMLFHAQCVAYVLRLSGCPAACGTRMKLAVGLQIVEEIWGARSPWS